MRILIAADIFSPESGGPATYCVTLANALVKDGCEVKIVSLNPDSDHNVLDKQAKLYSVCCKNKIVRYAHYFWLLFLQAVNAEVMYAMGPVNAGLPALIVSKLLRKKFVVKVVGDYAWEQWQNQKSKIKNQNLWFVNVDEFQSLKIAGKVSWLKKVEHMVVKNADKIIVPSRYLKKIVIGWGADEKKVKIIYNVEVNGFKMAEPIKHNGEKWLVSVGRLVSWKGFDTLIEIMPDLLKVSSEWRLKIVGGGPEMTNLQSKIYNLKLQNVIELTGDLSHDKTLAYIASADVFILNSGYEGLPNVVIEADNQGVPVLISNVGGNKELHAENSLFEYNNKQEIIEKVLQFSCRSKGKSIEHRFLGNMVEETKKVLE
jgi:glycosyltransferase involved in cell wall biosynthesis